MAAPIVDEHWHWHSLVAWRSFQTVISRPARSSTDLLWRTANPAALRKTGESSDVEVLRFSQGRPRVVPVYLICVRQMRCNDCRASVCFPPTHPRRNEMNLVRRRACVHHKMYGGWAVARDGPMGGFTPSESFTRFQHPLEGGADALTRAMLVKLLLHEAEKPSRLTCQRLDTIDRHIGELRQLIYREVELVETSELKSRDTERVQNLLAMLNDLMANYQILHRRFGASAL